MRTPDTIAQNFKQLDFHDNTFVDLRVSPPQVREQVDPSAVEVQLLQNSDQTVRSVRFSGCRNLRVALDFDVLAHNLSPNTSNVDAHTNLIRMRELMQSQKKDWGVAYGPGVESPVTSKMARMEGLVSFRLQFFGGVIEVIAQDYTVEIIEKK